MIVKENIIGRVFYRNNIFIEKYKNSFIYRMAVLNTLLKYNDFDL